MGLLVLLVALLAFTKLIQPTYGPPGIQGLAIAVLPLALATVGQAIVVISGGIDLSLGSIIAFLTVVAASLMKAYPEMTVVVVLGVLLLGMVVGAINGGLIVVTRVPDIVVTLAMSFVWAGAALLVLKTPGGAAADWLKDLLTGNVLIEWVPKAAVLLIVIVAVIWIPLRRSRLGLSFYAIGSNQLAAFRSGVPVGRTKIASYAFSGCSPRWRASASRPTPAIGQPVRRPVHAAERRRDRARRGQPRRRPRWRLRPDRGGDHPPADPRGHGLPQHQQQPRDRRQRRDPDRRRHARQPDPDPAGARPMSVATAPAPSSRSPYLTVAGWRRLFRDRPIIPLIVLLAILVLLYELVRPGQVSPSWAGVIARTAIPLAILAGCQVLTMLTGGIDLSVGSVASMSGFLVASLVGDYGLWPSVAVALLIATSAGLITGLGVGVFRVHPLIMSLGMGLVVFGFVNAWQLIRSSRAVACPPDFRWIGSANLTFVVGDVNILPPIPASLLLFVPLAALILFALRRTGYGRLLYAIGDNPIAVRLSGARSWQVLLVLYVISAFMAAIAGFLLSGGVNVASRDPRRFARPAVGRRSGHRRARRSWAAAAATAATIVGALILTVITALLSALGFPEAVRQVLFGAIIVVVAAAYTRVTGEG